MEQTSDTSFTWKSSSCMPAVNEALIHTTGIYSNAIQTGEVSSDGNKVNMLLSLM